jgi:acetyl-CoA/propionyl-CoA carboxylase biotin carboxyl carrier protein
VDKVLVANRGEVAVRILRGCRELGLTGVAVYSDADRDAPHVAVADEAWHIGAASPGASYLNIERIIGVAKKAGASAVHPGYGFLAENAAFAQAVIDAGIRWVGPPPEAIAAMGDKMSARQVAERAGAPLVPGTTEPIANPDEVIAFGDTHGYPIALKAAFGGGGRGMKVVAGPGEVAGALASAERESAAAFGRSEVYMERYLVAPRHVEAQILADEHGNVSFLGERDCSLQRRHQKLVEEAPAPGLPAAVRAEMARAATAISKTAGYVNAGTIEYLYEPATEKVYFLEMNTRLQVEHPVTELVSGIDIVAAEDPGAGFMPAPGLVTTWKEPAGPWVRVDAGVVEGFTIPQTYDSLMAKLIVWGADRAAAIRRMRRALDDFVIEGVPSTIPFHKLAMTNPDFVSGNVSTTLVEHDMDLSALAPLPSGAQAATPAKAPPRRMVIELEGKRFEVGVLASEPVVVPERPRTPRSPKALERARAESGGPGRETVTTPMQGTIVKVLAAEGDTVTSGQTLVVLEAMKMENHVVAHQSGVIAKLAVSEGETVATGATIAMIEPS